MEKSKVLASILEGLPSCIAMLDPQYNYIAISKEWNQLPTNAGVKIGESFFNLWPSDSEKWKATFHQVFQGETIENLRDHISTDEDDYYFKWSVTPLWGPKSESVEAILVFMEDITQQIITEYTLNHSEKMIALGEMAGGIAHEINNPLNIISAGVEVLDYLYQNEEKDYEKISKTLLTIKNTTFRISKIVTGLKNFSRSNENEDLQMQTADKVVQDALNLSIEKLSTSGIEVRKNIDEKMQFLCRPVEASQILINLIHNSRDALLELDGKHWIEITTEEDQKYSTLIVTDSGPGIPHKVARKMMNPFFTTKKLGKGTGLGLSISQKIAERNNAELVYDIDNDHTCFKLKFKRN